MTASRPLDPLDTPLCGARKRQPRYPGETCARPSGWGTEHPGYGRCKLHGGATPYKHGRYSKVVRQFLWPSIKWKLRALQLPADPHAPRRAHRLLLAEAGLCDEELEQGQAS